MYVVNGNWTFAIDVATGQQIWRTPVEYDRGAARVGAAGVIMRGGATIYNGKLFRETIDSHVIALDMKTGKQIWKQKFADFKEGYTGIIAPLVANGVVITGMAGGEPHHARLPRWLGSGNRQEAVAPLHHSRAGRARLRDLAQGHPGRLEIRRRGHVAERLLRPASSISSIGAPATPSRIIPAYRGGARQPLHRQRDRHPAEDRRTGLALSVHPERELRLRRHRRAGAGRLAHRRPGAQGAAQAPTRTVSCM